MWSPSLYQAARAGKRCWAFLAACFAKNGVINMAAWPVQDAKDKFCQLLRQAASHGPQIVTKRGVEIAVVVPIEIWRTFEAQRPPSIKTWLLAPVPRSSRELDLPHRKKMPVAIRDVDLE